MERSDLGCSGATSICEDLTDASEILCWDFYFWSMAWSYNNKSTKHLQGFGFATGDFILNQLLKSVTTFLKYIFIVL